ncbi:glycosyltransferase [Dyadobacter sp. 676]|uniref:Glycosyltransferase n=1 Tax=Dyadobacter sp. 676 TaxID=3088362 RepID=A0AAU8FK73_9BACT
MKILYDHQIYNNQNYGGISRYFYELSKGLTLLGNDCQNTIYFSENEFTKDRRMYDSRQFLPFKFKGRWAVKERLNRFVSERFIQKGDYDIFHPTYYDTYFLNGKLPNRPFVVTFYDLIHEKFSDRYPTLLTNMDKVISNREILLKRASRVIAISQSTKRDIVDYYGVAEDRIQVTHLASSFFARPDGTDENWGDYILFVGNRLGYKNFALFFEAIHGLLEAGKEPKADLCGRWQI